MLRLKYFCYESHNESEKRVHQRDCNWKKKKKKNIEKCFREEQEIMRKARWTNESDKIIQDIAYTAANNVY